MESNIFSKHPKCNSHKFDLTTPSMQKKSKYQDNSNHLEANLQSKFTKNKSFFAENSSQENPFYNSIKPSDKFKKASQMLERNNNFINLGTKDFPFLQDFQREKDSDVTWILSNSSISKKLEDNSTKIADVISKFNDSSLF